MDGCRRGWVIATLDAVLRTMEFTLVPTFAEVAAQARTAAACAVDIPIGLREDFTPRACDVGARQLLGRQSSSIFLAPPRRLLGCTSQAEASAISRAQCGQGVSIQAFHLFAKIAEVDRAMPAPVFEAHPELAFRARAGGQDLPRKKTSEGYAARRQLLAAWAGIPAREQASPWGSAAVPDDLLDAAVLADVAWRQARGEARHVGDEAQALIWF